MTIQTTFDNAANDSDKSFVVPAGRIWKMHWAHVELTTTATVGNRQIKMSILDESANEVITAHAGAVQAAGLTRHYEILKGIYRETAFVSNAIQVPLPQDLVLLPGWTLRFFDSATVDVAADDMTVAFQYDEQVERTEL